MTASALDSRWSPLNCLLHGNSDPFGTYGIAITPEVNNLVLFWRDYVIPDDVKALAEPVLGHRLIISPAARIRNVTANAVMNDILNAVAVPGARAGRRYDREASPAVVAAR